MGLVVKYRLNIGRYRDGIASRYEETREFDTEGQAYESYVQSKWKWIKQGYVVWYAEIITPEGNRITLESNPYYH